MSLKKIFRRLYAKTYILRRNFLKKAKYIVPVFFVLFIIILVARSDKNKDKTVVYKAGNNSPWSVFLFGETIPYFNNYGTNEKKYDYTEAKNISYADLDKYSFEEIKSNLYSIDLKAFVYDYEIEAESLKGVDVTVNLNTNEPKILIFHTHSQEAFIDSQPGAVEDTIVGVGQTLAEILVNDYGISVIHDFGQYDIKDGNPDRGNSYENMEPYIKKILEQYPSVEIVIDLHRDGVAEEIKFVMEINGKPTARIMFFNGICRLNENGEGKDIEDLENPYITENLAFSFNMQLMSNTLYPGLARKIYIKPYRYSLHLVPLSLLIEVGANTNTVEEAKNAMGPLAEILVGVISR